MVRLLGRPAQRSRASRHECGIDLPRKPEEIQRAWATFQITGCQVKTDGARLEVTFPGVTLGVFSGDLRYTVYRGTNLLRQEVVAKTDAPSVAYKFVAGLKGFAIGERHAPGVARHCARLAALPVRRRTSIRIPWR